MYYVVQGLRVDGHRTVKCFVYIVLVDVRFDLDHGKGA